MDEVERALSKPACADSGGADSGSPRWPGTTCQAGSCWVLTRLAKQCPVSGVSLAAQAGVSVSEGRPYVDRLVAAGMVVGDQDGVLRLTGSGQAAADRLFAARREGLRELLADWSPEQHAELAELLNKLSRALLGENADRHLISR